MWQCLEVDTTADEIVKKVLGAFEGDVDESVVRADVDAFIKKLEGAGVLE